MTQTASPPISANGKAPPFDRERIQDILTGEPLTTGYKPTLPLWALWVTDTIPQFYLLRDIEMMMIHPTVLNALNYFKGGIAGAEFDLTCQDQIAAPWIMDQCQRFWDRGVPKLQGGYEYGWIGCEALYKGEGAELEWDDFIQFSPRDVFLLTQAAKPVGLRVRQIVEQPQRDQNSKADGQLHGGTRDLWLATEDIPAKGIWYAHNPRYSTYYGQSQLLGAWRPWRRLAWKDAAETVADGGIYRYAYSGIIVNYPEEDLQTQPGTPNTTLDSQGNPRRYARDYARQIAEWFKTGAGIGVPSTMYPPELGGGPKWKVEVPKNTLSISGIMEYIQYLIKQIREGIGVPSELFEAAESGSGYSGRAIPLEGFLMLQQRLADALLTLFLKQILKPLVRWRYGDIKFDVKVKPLLQTKRQSQMGQPSETAPNTQAPSTTQGMPGLPAPSNQPLGAPPSPGVGSQGFSIDLNTDRIKQIARKIRQAA
jgi:hypothetical protein